LTQTRRADFNGRLHCRGRDGEFVDEIRGESALDEHLLILPGSLRHCARVHHDRVRGCIRRWKYIYQNLLVILLAQFLHFLRMPHLAEVMG